MYIKKLSTHSALHATREKNNLIKNELVLSQLTHSENNFVKKALYFIDNVFGISSIHGLIYLRRPQRHIFEQIIWLVAIYASIWGAFSVSINTWHRYQVKPTVISIERDYRAWNTTFPALTICPIQKTDITALKQTIKSILIGTEDTDNAEEFLTQLNNATFRDFSSVPNYNKIPPALYVRLSMKSRFVLKIEAVETNVKTQVPNSLQMSFTEHGICYAFNSVIAHYNDPKYWGEKNWTNVKNIIPIVGNPLDGDIYAHLMNINSEYIYFIHSPEEVPDIVSKSNRAQAFSFKELHINAVSIFSADEVRSLSVAQRRCRFLDESELDISPVYSYNLCNMQCRSELCYKLCHCVPHFYRHTGKYRLCGAEGLHCLGKHKEVLLHLSTSKNKGVTCQCLPVCDDTNYFIEAEKDTDWPLGRVLKWGLIKYPHYRLKRDILFGFSDVLVGIGGTAGLFLGCSVLSFIEIIYFISLRLFWFILRK